MRLWSAGTPEPQKVEIVDKYSVAIPDNLCTDPRGWKSEDGECELPKQLYIELEDPYFMTPGSAFRYNMEIKKIGLLNTGNATLARFVIHTNMGQAFSGLVYIQQ